MCVPNRVSFRNAQILYMCPGEKVRYLTVISTVTDRATNQTEP